MPDELSRRRFLRSATPLVAAPAVLRRAALGAGEALRAGLIGCGARGPYIGYVFQDTPGVDIAALCDVHKGHLEKASGLMNRLGRKPALYHDYRKLLDDKTLDVIIVATNAHWHVLPAMDACRAGKDVYLEKPVATSIGEGRAAIRTAERTGRIIQMGLQQRSWPHYAKAVDIVRSGSLGEISHVHVWDVKNFHPGFGSPPDGEPPAELDWDFWLGPSPKVPYNPNRTKHHYFFFDYGGGWEVAWGAHHYDIVHWAMGVRAPVAASGSGGKFAFFHDNRQWPDTFDGACEYPPGPAARSGFLLSYTLRTGCAQPVEGRGHGKAFYGTKGVLIVNRQGYEVRSEERGGKKLVAEKKSRTVEREHDAVRRHVRSFLESVRTRKAPVAGIREGHEATNPGHLMNIAWRVGRRVAWDAERERIAGDPEAQAFVTKTYRPPWRLG